MSRRTWQTSKAFYAEDPRRLSSAELDFGCWWREDDGDVRWRVSLVVDTGELYATCLAGSWCEFSEQVELLATITPGEHVPGIVGWGDLVFEDGSLCILRDRLARAQSEA